MIQSKKSNIDNVIKGGRLKVNNNFLTFIDKLAVYFLFSLFVLVPVFLYSRIAWTNPNDKFIGIVVFPILIFVGLYSIFRKFRENKLMCITTENSLNNNKESVLKFLERKGYSTQSKSRNEIYAFREHGLSYNGLWQYQIAVVLDNNKIYLNLTKHGPKINFPVFLSHLFLRRDLEKYLKNKPS